MDAVYNSLQRNRWSILLKFLDVCFWNRSFFWFMLLGVGSYTCTDLAWFSMIQMIMGLLRFESLTWVLFNTFLLVPWAKELARNPPEDDWTHSEAAGKNPSKLCEHFPQFLFKAATVYLCILRMFHAFSPQVLYQLDWCTCSQMIWHKRCGQVLTATAKCLGLDLNEHSLPLSSWIHFDELQTMDPILQSRKYQKVSADGGLQTRQWKK